MRKLLCVLLFGVLLEHSVNAEYKDYENYKVLRVTLRTEEQRKEFADFGEKLNLDFWQGPSYHVPTDIMVSPEQFDEVAQFIKQQGITFDVINENVGKTIRDERKGNDNLIMRKKFRSLGDNVVGTFAQTSDIKSWLSTMARRYDFCSIINIGKSYEGRKMQVLRMATGENKPIIFVDAGIHAREWLAPATIIYVMNQLATDYKNGDSEARSLLEKYEFQFLPIVNPDGYQYTFLSRSTRLWRKNRKPYGSCYGVDPNRNFDAAFGGASTSGNPCSDLYRGPYAFSEPETQNLRDHILSIKHNLKMYLSTHSYAQYWLVPFAYTSALPADNDELLRVANIGNDALFKTNGVRFQVGSPPQLLYAAAGGSYDWVKIKAGVKYAYTFELRPGRGFWGGSGFIPPVSSIVPSGKEIYNAIKATANAIRI